MELNTPVISRFKALVAVEADSEQAVFFFHDASSFRKETFAFRPFAAAAGSVDLPGVSCEKLSGGLILDHLLFFDSADAEKAALKELEERKLPCLRIRDLRQQALTFFESRLFVDMPFAELRRMAVDITCGNNGEIVQISAAMPDGPCRNFADAPEKELLTEFTDFTIAADPDIITGDNIFQEIFPLLTAAAKRCKQPLAIGRDGKTPVKRPGRFVIAGNPVSYSRYEVNGRHIIDTDHLIRLYDSSHRDMDSTSLEGAAEYFSLTNRSGAAAALELFDLLAPSYYYQCRLLPLRFQETPLKGNGSCVDALLSADYLARRHSLPLPGGIFPYQGALTRSEQQGVFRPVIHCDVRSLYPSILLAMDAAPENDRLRRFPEILRSLRQCRLAAKDASRNAASPAERRENEALQSAFKILINSFYGYLGFAQGAFNDCRLAEKVTAAGREILQKMLQTLADAGAGIIEADTDGVYFQLPDDDTGAGTIRHLLEEALPDGIDVEFDGSYRAMFSYKSKNYALLKDDGSLKITGAALKSRALESFQREFIVMAVKALLDGCAAGELDNIHRSFCEAISGRKLPLAKLTKSEVLKDSPENYRKKLSSGSGRRSAAYEAALASGKSFRAGDRINFYVTGSSAKVAVSGNCRFYSGEPEAGGRDENIAYYLAEADALYRMFKPFFI